MPDANATETVVNKAETTEAAKFTVEQLSKSKQFTPIEKNILSVMLDPAAVYSIAEANTAIKKFMKKEVK